MEKQWFNGVIVYGHGVCTGETTTPAEELVRFANRNRLKPREIVVIQNDGGIVRIGYYADRKLS